ncbi:MAG: LD-carboxypeptidase [Desulfamplus sp.]|nr:LD-carboxypeptidase [Desulfamplus sp.]
MNNNMPILKYKTPKPLKSGDTLGVCAPSGSFDPQKFSQGVKILQSMGFEVHIPIEIYERKRYMAGDDKSRASVINTLFDNSSIKGIICARGGFGALRTLDYINYHLIANHPKMFVGFSDATALLTAISERAMIQVLHGPVVTTLADSCSETLGMLYGQLTSYPSERALHLRHGKTLRKGVASGRLAGGNLATLCHLTGTKFQPDLNGTILFLEDVGEPPYKIDRMLTQMKLAGLFQGVKGVIAGSFERCDHHSILKTGVGHRDEDNYRATSGHDILRIHEAYRSLSAQDIIEEILLEIFDIPDQPVLSGLDAGHGKINLSLRLSATVELDSEKKCLLWTMK